MRPSQLQNAARDFRSSQEVSARAGQETSFRKRNAFRKTGLFLGLLTVGAHALGCGGGGAGFVAPSLAPPPPAPSVSVSVSPSSANVLLGNTQAFAAKVNGADNAAVTWSVNGVSGGSAALGTISAAGVYTAPADLPVLAAVQIAATSQADPTKTGTANVSVVSDIALAVMPATANVELGAVQPFRATIASNGRPDPAAHWSVNGTDCPNACGSVDANGNYTAPQILPPQSNVLLTAQSVADPTKQVSAPIRITSNFSFQLSAPANLSAGAAALLTATLTPVPGSHPSAIITWTLSGQGCSGATCGMLSVGAQTIAPSGAIATSVTYAAPVAAPAPNGVIVTATPQADPSKAAQAVIQIQTDVAISLSPLTATLAINHRITLSAQITGTANTSVAWNVNGIVDGNSAIGQICVAGSNPCQAVANGAATQVDFLAPGALPQPNPVTVEAVSLADGTKTASAQITVVNHVIVSVLPASAALAPLGVQQFAATVLGTTNQNVVWQIQGTPCGTAGVCGSISAGGMYMAPGAAPNPDALQVVAISSDDTTQSGTANVSISTGADIFSLHPASGYAGAADGFTLLVEGGGFAATSPGPGSSLLIGGTARTTSCASVTTCTAPVTPADVAVAGSVSVQIENPDGTKSNEVSLIVVQPGASDEVVSLTSGSPAAIGKNIVVVEPTTAGDSALGNDVDLNVAALGAFSVANNNCTLGGNPIVLLPPASGTSTTDICLFSQSGLDASMTYVVSGPGDLTVAAKQPAGLGIIHLTLQISANAAPGARTLFIQNTNLDKTAATGALEIP